MRNLKKVLALVLALVMSLSLVTIANAADFSDNADIDYSEAVDVMVAAGIIDGVGTNSFDPNGTLTREQAAKLITYMLLGENSEKLGIESSSFKDVAVTRWSAPAIEYCASLGIIDGAGDGNFYPAGKLTGFAFAKMLLTALGYDSQIEKFVGASWTINVATLGMEVGLDDGLETVFGSAEISRQEAAQMALNAIKAPLVEYDNDSTISVNGATVQINGGSAKFVTTTLAKEQRISNRTLTNTGANTQNSGYTVEFGEKYLPKLELKGETDAFGRPSYTWSYDKEEIGTYVDYTNLTATYTEEVTGKELYDVLGKSIVDDIDSSASDRYRLFVYIDGEDSASVNDAIFGVSNKGISKNNKDGVGATGNGVLTQVFIDADSRVVTIAIINTYLAKARADYNAKRDEVSFDVFGIDKKGSEYIKDLTDDEDKEILTASGEDFAIEDVKKDDIYRVAVAEGGIQLLVPAEVVTGTSMSSFKLDSYVVAGGNTYNYADAAEYDVDVLNKYTTASGTVNLKDKSYNIYLDEYGYLLGIELVDEVKNYVFITGVDLNSSNLSARNVDANAIFLDGKMETITYDSTKSTISLDQDGDDTVDFDDDNLGLLNTWCTYTVSKDGIYTLKEVSTGEVDSRKVAQNHDTAVAGDKIDKKHISLTGSTGYSRIYGNDDTVYLNAAVKTIKVNSAGGAQTGIIDDVDSVTIGVAKADFDVYAEGNNGGGSTAADANSASAVADANGKVQSGNYCEAVAYGAYALYDDDGYIIAAVVVADDGANSDNWVYVTSKSVTRESYDTEKDEWTWSREVVANGEITEITETGDSLGYLDTMEKYNWYKVRYKGDGTVKDVQLAVDALAHVNGTETPTAASGSDEYEGNIKHLDKTINAGKDTILYEASGYTKESPNLSGIAVGTNGYAPFKDQAGKPHLTGSTFFVSNDDSTGFHVDTNVKTVFIQTNDNKETIDTFTGKDDLEDAVSDLNEARDGKYDYEVSAVLNSGSAQVVIIRDLNESDGKTIEGGNKPDGSSDVSKKAIAVYDSNGDKVTFICAGGTLTTKEKTDLIKALAADELGVPEDELSVKKVGSVWNIVTEDGDEYAWNEQTAVEQGGVPNDKNVWDQVDEAMDGEDDEDTLRILQELKDLAESGMLSSGAVATPTSATTADLTGLTWRKGLDVQVDGYGKAFDQTLLEMYGPQDPAGSDADERAKVADATHWAVVGINNTANDDTVIYLLIWDATNGVGKVARNSGTGLVTVTDVSDGLTRDGITYSIETP